MALTKETLNRKLIDQIKSLIYLDHDAIAAYEVAIQRLENAECRERLSTFKEDHRRHVRDLGQLLSAIGEPIPAEGDMKEVLTKGKVVMGNLMGDKGILQAMKSNEDDTNQKYEQALERTDLVSEVRTVFARNLEDERRHRRWIIEFLDRNF